MPPRIRPLCTHALAVLVGLATACFKDEGPTNTCAEGDATCPCFVDGTCNGVLVCDAATGRCVGPGCTPGDRDCPCDSGQCLAGLVCNDVGLCEGLAGTTGAVTLSGGSSSPATAETASLGSDSTSDTTSALDSTANPTSATVGSTDSTDDGEPGVGTIRLYSTGPLPGAMVETGKDVAETRTALDTACMDADVPPECAAPSHALIGVGKGDSIATMPARFGFPADVPVVASPVGPTFAEDFATFVAGPLVVALANAGVVTNNNPVWTGATENGDLSADRCDGWNTNGVTGTAGDSTSADPGWISTEARNCTSAAQLLCVCWVND